MSYTIIRRCYDNTRAEKRGGYRTEREAWQEVQRLEEDDVLIEDLAFGIVPEHIYEVLTKEEADEITQGKF